MSFSLQCIKTVGSSHGVMESVTFVHCPYKLWHMHLCYMTERWSHFSQLTYSSPDLTTAKNFGYFQNS